MQQIIKRHIDAERVAEYLHSQQGNIIETLKAFVERPSCAREPEDARAFGKWLKIFLENEGFSCKLLDVGNGNGEVLSAVIGAVSSKEPVLFCGHYDTVMFRKSMMENPFFRKDGKIHGVGVLDMKGGIVIAIYAVRALLAAGFCDRPIKLLFAGDEESCHTGSTAGEIIKAESLGCCAAFSMETGLLNNALTLGRKGLCRCVAAIDSRNESMNAIAVMAEKGLRLASFTNLEAGTTVNTSVISGTSRHCEATMDMRCMNSAEEQKVLSALRKLFQDMPEDGVLTHLSFADFMPVYDQTPASEALLAYLNAVASTYGLAEMGSGFLGGSSDAAYPAMMGVPTICSCGARGEWNHTAREYIIESSLAERSTLLALAVLHLNEFQVTT